MKKIVNFFKNEHVQASLVSGSCILLLAIAFKKYLHLEIHPFENAIPGLVFTGYELVRAKKYKGFWTTPKFWFGLMIGSTIIIILRHVI
jgi:hypothetical protein